MTDASGHEDTYGGEIDLDGVRRTWPDGRDLPDIIDRFGSYLLDKPLESVGYLRMLARRVDDYWIERGADLSQDFGVFMQFSEGTALAVWFHLGAIDGAEPVVLLGSEGELKIVAPNLKAFVAKWASGRGPLELRRQRRERSLWLEDVALGLCEIVESTPDPAIGARVPNLQAFFDAHSERALAQDASDPTLLEMARVLAAYVPKASQPWARTLLRVAIAGDRIEIVGRKDRVTVGEVIDYDYRSRRHRGPRQ